MRTLVDELMAPDFILRSLFFGLDPVIEVDKLVVIGHQIGATSLEKLARADNRIKAVISLDRFFDKEMDSQIDKNDIENQ